LAEGQCAFEHAGGAKAFGGVVIQRRSALATGPEDAVYAHGCLDIYSRKEGESSSGKVAD
jgi:hypothetical protein